MRDDSEYVVRLDDAITTTRPYIDQYVRTPNRLAFGERTVIVMSSKVAQKSYGTEKRYVLTWPVEFRSSSNFFNQMPGFYALLPPQS
jgi:recombining binding protein (suppressor of hairless)